MNPIFIISLSGIAGIAVGVLVMMGISRAGLNKNEQKAEQLLKEAQIEADAKIKQAVLEGKTQAHDLRIVAEKEIKDRKQETMQFENKLLRREDNLNFRDEALTQKEKQISDKLQKANDKLASLDAKEKKLQEQIDKQILVLEGVAKMSSQDAQKELEQAQQDFANMRKKNYLLLLKRKWSMKQSLISKTKKKKPKQQQPKKHRISSP